ncbi:MAG: chemotaxis protein MotB [Gammaproteobacteria bacterium]
MSRLDRIRAEQQSLEDASVTNRWIISYADFITLLFAFFVVMYSISSVNDGKFRVLSGSIATEFSNESQDRPAPIDLGGAPLTSSKDDLQSSTKFDEVKELALEDDMKPFSVQDTETLSERVANAIAPLIDDERVIVRDGQSWLQVELPSKLLFSSGHARLSDEAQPLLVRLAQAMNDVSTPIRVEGFTDNVPMSGNRFASNWELSAARAAAVVDRFSRSGVDPELLSAVGFGEFHPRASNENSAGRTKNRRVVVAIAKHKSVGLGASVGEPQAQDRVQPTDLLRITDLPGGLGIL